MGYLNKVYQKIFEKAVLWKKVHVNVTVTAVLSVLVWITHVNTLKNAISDNVRYWWNRCQWFCISLKLQLSLVQETLMPTNLSKTTGYCVSHEIHVNFMWKCS